MAVEYLNAEGLRVDGRRAREARAVAVHFGVVPGADGSAECRLGQTIACAAVYGPLDGGRSADAGGEGSAYGAASGGAELRVEYAEARFAAAGMRARRLGRARQADSAAPLKAALASAVLLEQLPRSRVEVRVHVLSADGGAVACGLNAAAAALADAGVPMRDLPACVEVTHLDGEPLLDLTHLESSAGGARLLVALLPQLGEVVACEAEGKLAAELLEPMLELGVEGARGVGAAVRDAVLDTAARRAARLAATLEEQEEGGGGAVKMER